MVSPRRNDAPEPVLGGPPQSILVVDDMPVDIGMLIATLSDAGYRVRAAPDGQNALEQARHMPPDLVLLDAEMSGMAGFETCQRLRQLPTLVETPVIFMIELSQPYHRVDAFAAGADDYVTKPFQYQEVLGRVRLHLRRHALESELERLHRQFEKRVTERTVELKATIAESEALRHQLQRENRALKEQARRRDKLE
jgi:DNA-binding response OmpR family regulator